MTTNIKGGEQKQMTKKEKKEKVIKPKKTFPFEVEEVKRKVGRPVKNYQGPKGAGPYVPHPAKLAKNGKATWPKDYVTMRQADKIIERLDKIAKILAIG